MNKAVSDGEKDYRSTHPKSSKACSILSQSGFKLLDKQVYNRRGDVYHSDTKLLIAPSGDRPPTVSDTESRRGVDETKLCDWTRNATTNWMCDDSYDPESMATVNEDKILMTASATHGSESTKEAPQGLASNWYCEDSQDYTLPPIGAELSLCTDQTEGLLVGWMVQFMINESM